jgi:two-component system, LytTR family, response regulator
MSHALVIIEDEPPARAKLKRFIGELADFHVVAEAATVEEGIAAVTQHAPQAIYLDIQLGTGSGFEVLEGIRAAASPLIVFTTAYSEHAVKAFEVQALDYLLKPFDRERFLDSIERLRARLAQDDHSDTEERVRRMLAMLPGRPAAAQQILVRDGERAFFLAVAQIQRVAAAGNYVEVHAAGRVHLIREPLSVFIAQLDPAEFLRVHRSHVVRISFIAELRALFHGDYELQLRDGTALTLSRRYKALLPDSIRDRL